MCSVMQLATLPLGGASSMTLYTDDQHGHDAHLGDAQCEVTSSPPSQQSSVSMTCDDDELSVSTLPMPDVRESLVQHAPDLLKICRRSEYASAPLKRHILSLKTVVGQLCKPHNMKDGRRVKMEGKTNFRGT